MKTLLTMVAACGLAWSIQGADFEKAVNDLIPRLADTNVPARYPAQMEMQDLASDASKPGNSAAREALGKLLAAKVADPTVAQPARVWLVRQLEHMGGAEAVDALTKVMNGDDAELRECARRALEKNPSPLASTSLRNALQKNDKPAWKIGLINALGQRRDAGAVGAIAGYLDDTEIGTTAIWALGRIATPEVVNLLMPLVGKNLAAGEALSETANQMRVKGNLPVAKVIYLRLIEPGKLASVRAAALSGLAQLDAAGAEPFINQALTSNQPHLQQVAIQAAAKGGRASVKTLVDAFPKLPASAQTQILGVLDASAESTIVSASANADDGVRLAAIEAMGRVGSAASVPALLGAAGSDKAADTTAAAMALTKISGPGAPAAIVKAAGEGAGATRVVAINALAARQDRASAAVLLKGAGDTDATVRKAAFGALGKVAADADFNALAKLVLKAPTADATSALEAVAARLKDKAAAAKTLLSLVGNHDAVISAVLPALGLLGGPDALKLVVRLSASPDATVQEQALRALGNWPDFEATKTLLAVATNPQSAEPAYVLAMKGVVQLVRSLDNAPAAARADVALAAFAATRRDDEKRLLLPALATVPHPKAIAFLKPLLNDQNWKIEAGLAAASLAELLTETDKTAAKDLAGDLLKANISGSLNRRANMVMRQ
jgi:HEAT repeat protein